jgi:hypothetical protein
MILQSVGGVKRGEFLHGAVACDLGDDGGGGDGGAARIAVDDGEFVTGKTGLTVAIDQAEVRLEVKTLDRAAHGEETGAENIVRLDFLEGGDADGPVDLGMAAEEMIELGAILGDEQLRVVEMAMSQAIGQDRRRRIDRTRPAAAADFIHPGDDGHAFGAQATLEFPAQGITAFAEGHGEFF